MPCLPKPVACRLRDTCKVGNRQCSRLLDSDVYRRGKTPDRYADYPPIALNDGWSTGTLDSADIDVAGNLQKLTDLTDITGLGHLTIAFKVDKGQYSNSRTGTQPRIYRAFIIDTTDLPTIRRRFGYP